jgi:hypothetical protein
MDYNLCASRWDCGLIGCASRFVCEEREATKPLSRVAFKTSKLASAAGTTLRIRGLTRRAKAGTAVFPAGYQASFYIWSGTDPAAVWFIESGDEWQWTVEKELTGVTLGDTLYLGHRRSGSQLRALEIVLPAPPHVFFQQSLSSFIGSDLRAFECVGDSANCDSPTSKAACEAVQEHACAWLPSRLPSTAGAISGRGLALFPTGSAPAEVYPISAETRFF